MVGIQKMNESTAKRSIHLRLQIRKSILKKEFWRRKNCAKTDFIWSLRSVTFSARLARHGMNNKSHYDHDQSPIETELDSNTADNGSQNLSMIKTL